ncbi:MAG: ComEC family DNA internalization-related competence protein, partial [Gemmatimonadaceae bacterium]|nr:ComEC family DNA internalization-related competence protein [Gemmatimonadaceae bacterium]
VVPRSWPRRWRQLVGALVVSVVATVATAPLVAWSFGRVALLAPVANLAADPLMALAQPLLFLAMAVPVPAAERLMSDASHALLRGFHAVAMAIASVPGAAPAVAPTTAGAFAAGIVSVAILVACVARRPTPWILLALGGVAAMVYEPLLPVRGDATELHMLDVGQGDAIAIRTRAGHWILIDAGRAWRGGDAGRSVVVPYVSHRGGDVALFVISHPHADHVGGAASVLRALRPSRLLDPGYAGSTPSYHDALDAAHERQMPWQRVRPGDSLVVDEVVLTALAPDSAWASGLQDANLASTVLIVNAGGVRVLLTGDAEGPEEEWLLTHAATLGADVLKVGHHGSRTSTTPAFLAAVHPRLALVSVGAHNAYGHPDAEVMDALRSAGATVLRTDQSGTIVLRLANGLIDVETRDARWTMGRR